MSESEQYVSVITLESSSDTSKSVDKEIELSKKHLVLDINNCSDNIQPEESVAIMFETIEQESMSVKSESASINSSNCANDENGITNQAFVHDNEVTVNLKKGHQRSPSRIHEKEEMVCSQGMSLYIPR